MKEMSPSMISSNLRQEYQQKKKKRITGRGPEKRKVKNSTNLNGIERRTKKTKRYEERQNAYLKIITRVCPLVIFVIIKDENWLPCNSTYGIVFLITVLLQRESIENFIYFLMANEIN